jgi:glycine rich protein
MSASRRGSVRRALAQLLLAALIASGLAVAPLGERRAGADPGSASFSYTGAAQTWQVPSGVTEVQVDVRGAQGGNANYGGLGGRVRAVIDVTPSETLQINVGGQPSGTAAGFGGGGATSGAGYGGGGASDIRRGSYALADRLVVGGCFAGANGTAAELARELGSTVTAPTGRVILPPRQTSTMLEPGGIWKEFG